VSVTRKPQPSRPRHPKLSTRSWHPQSVDEVVSNLDTSDIESRVVDAVDIDQLTENVDVSEIVDKAAENIDLNDLARLMLEEMSYERLAAAIIKNLTNKE